MSNEHEVSEARARCEAYAKRIEELWDADPAVRARIECGLEQLANGQVVSVDIEQLVRKHVQAELTAAYKSVAFYTHGTGRLY